MLYMYHVAGQYDGVLLWLFDEFGQDLVQTINC